MYLEEVKFRSNTPNSEQQTTYITHEDKHVSIRLIPPPTTETETQRAERWAVNQAALSSAITSIRAPARPTYHDRHYFSLKTAHIIQDTNMPDSNETRPRVTYDPQDWQIGDIIDHQYHKDGCHYLVTDKSTRVGDTAQYEFTADEIERYATQGRFRQEIKRKQQLQNGRWHVEWGPFWTHSKSLADRTRDEYWRRRHTTLEKERFRLPPQTDPTYTTDTTPRWPDHDIQPGHSNIHRHTIAGTDTDYYTAHDADGTLRGTIRPDRFHHLLDQALTKNPALTKEDFITHTIALLTRYPPLRSRSTKKKETTAFRNEWALKPELTNPIISRLGLNHELFSHPLNSNTTIAHSWAPTKLDEHFNSLHDSFSWNWHDLNIGNPEYEPAALKKFVRHAIQASKTADPGKPQATVALLPFFTDHEYTRLLDSTACRYIWTLPRKSKFNFNPPDYWTGRAQKPTEADFELRFYIIANQMGWDLIKHRASKPTQPWGHIHDILEKEATREGWRKGTHLNPTPPDVGTPWRKLPSYNDTPPPEHLKTISNQGITQAKNWGFDTPIPELKYDPETCVYTDGSYVKSYTTGEGEDEVKHPAQAGSGVTTTHAEVCGTLDNTQIINAHRAEVIALVAAVQLVARIDPTKHWHIFTDSLVSLHTLAKYKRDQSRLADNPAREHIEQIAQITQNMQVSFHKVQAHAGVVGNERADELAAIASGSSKTFHDRTPRGLPTQNFTDSPNGVLIRTADDQISRDGQTNTRYKVHPFRQHYSSLYKNATLFPAGTPSPWRNMVHKIDSAPCAPMSKAVREKWTTAHERTFLKICHNDFMTQKRAAAYTTLRPYKSHKRRANETQWRKKLRTHMASLPSLPAECPLCENKADGLMHALLWCKHHSIKSKRIKRHNRILAKLLPAVRAGRRGAHYLTGDLPGWGYDEQRDDLAATGNGGAERQTELPDENPNILHVDPLQTTGLTQLIGSSDEETEATPPSPTHKDTPWDPNTITATLTEDLMALAQPPSDQDSDSDTTPPTRTIMPPEWGDPGSRRPDGLLIEGHTIDGRRADTPNKTAHYFDVTVTSENSVFEAITKKLEQYREPIAIAERNGYKAILHVIPIGVRGFIPHHTHRALNDLGLRPAEIHQFETDVGRITKEASVGLVWSRRRTEMNLTNAATTSGAYREKEFRRLKKHYINAYPPGRPPG